MELIGKPKLIRKINRKLILKYIRSKKILTKAELYELTNLSKQTINNIITGLLKKNLVIKAGYGNSTKEGGKKPLLLKFNSRAHFLIGVMIGLNRIRCGITDLNGEIIKEEYIKTLKDSGSKNIIKNITTLINKLIQDSKIDRNLILGIGIGVPGIANINNGLVEMLPLFKGWENIYLGKIIENKFNIKVVVDNENRMNAMGEKWFGLAKNKNNSVVIITGDGIGGGIIINGEVLRGNNFFSGEIGHMKLSLDGPLCNCGSSGCFETLINTKSINNYFKEIIRNNSFEESKLFKIFKEKGEISLNQLFINYNNKDKIAELIMEKLIKWFALGISNLVCLYDPEIIIIHGEYTVLNKIFFNKLNELINLYVFPKLRKKITIKKTNLGPDIGIVGAISMVLDIIDL